MRKREREGKKGAPGGDGEGGVTCNGGAMRSVEICIIGILCKRALGLSFFLK